MAKPPGPAVDLEKVYRCVDCERTVAWPEILYNDGQCEDCRKASA